MMPTIYIASDHAGSDLKVYLIAHLKKGGYNVIDMGPMDNCPTDYPKAAEEVANALYFEENEENSRGILICGTGLGMSMAANRWRHIRAALCTMEFHARKAREHNDANILCLGSRVTGHELAAGIAEVFLTAKFAGGRHVERLAMFN